MSLRFLGDDAFARPSMVDPRPTGFWATYHCHLATKTVVEDQVRAIGYRELRFARAEAAAAVTP